MQLLEIPSGMQGLYLKLQAMRDLVLKGTTDQRIIKATYELIKDVPARNKQKESEKILNYIRKNIRYLEDPVSVELIKSTPRLLLEYKQGDCDCQSTLLATMLNIIGIPTRFIAIKTILDNDYSHVYVEADIHRVGMYYSMDTTVEKPIGWESKLIEEKAYIDNKDGRIWTERKGDSMARLGDSLMILDGLKQVGWLRPVDNLRRSGLSQAELGTVIDTIGTIITNVLVSLSEQKTPQWYQKFSEEVNKLNTILQQVPEAEAKMRQIIEDSKKSTIEKWITNPISWVVGGIAIVLGFALVSKK